MKCTSEKSCDGCDWSAKGSCYVPGCVFDGKEPGEYKGKHENCVGCGDCLKEK